VAFAGKTLYGDLTDDHGHGTHTSSTAASAWGIASDAEILMLNGLPGGYGSEADIAAKIRQLADNGCAAISLSLGGSASSVIDAACQYARGKGSVVVAAAGNTHGAPSDPPPARRT
jgi:subtilisin family serine protease